MIMIAGIIWMLAAGSSEKVAGARKMIGNAIVGLILALGTYTVLSLINPNLVILKNINLTPIERIELKIDATVSSEVATSISEIRGTLVQRINNLMSLYKEVAKQEDIPWELLATIHYREASNEPTASSLNGKSICNGEDNSRCSACDDGSTLKNDLICAAKELKQKAQITGYKNINYIQRDKKFTLNENTNDVYEKDNGKIVNFDSAIANVLYRYNGVGYGAIQNSPYVMNNLNDSRKEMITKGCETTNCCEKKGRAGENCNKCCHIVTINKQNGGLIFFINLKDSANYKDGKLFKL